MKNKWESLKRFYSFWLVQQANGTGSDSYRGIAASDNFWKTHTKVQLPSISCFYSLDYCMMMYINAVNTIYFL
jgi:hypothetical protein